MRSRAAAESATAAAVPAAFERRASRARALAGESKTAGPVLGFAAGLYRAQARLAAAIAQRHVARSFSGRLEEDAPRFADGFGELLAFAVEHGPPALAEAARSRGDDDAPEACARLLEWWARRQTGTGHEEHETAAYLTRALLRPYAEVLAALEIRPVRARSPGHCGFCGGAPWIASRRTEPGGEGADGAQRRLGCALCGAEWRTVRIHCPACSEEDPAKLPVFRSDTYTSVRIEACETCRRYIKSIDLTLDNRSIPEVDDLLSLGMDLWALDEGFTRIEPGLAGV